MIPWVPEKGPFAVEINQLSLFPLRTDVPMNRIVSLIHDPLKVLVGRGVRVNLPREAFALIGQIKNLGVDLRSNECLELTTVFSDLGFTQYQNGHIDERFRKDWRYQCQLKTIPVQIGSMFCELVNDSCLLLIGRL